MTVSLQRKNQLGDLRTYLERVLWACMYIKMEIPGDEDSVYECKASSIVGARLEYNLREASARTILGCPAPSLPAFPLSRLPRPYVQTYPLSRFRSKPSFQSPCFETLQRSDPFQY